jgi:hypothetical protein
MAERAAPCVAGGVELVVILLERHLGEIIFLLLLGSERLDTPQSANTVPVFVSLP